MKLAYGATALARLLSSVIGCGYISGGVAGASFDPIWEVKSAERYPQVVATSRVRVTVALLTGERPPQMFEGIMHAFPVHQERIDIFGHSEIRTISMAGQAEHLPGR